MFNKLCTLEQEDGYVVANCTKKQAEETFDLAFKIVVNYQVYQVEIYELSDDSCRIEASQKAWTIYYCALSLSSTKIHPMALQLTAAFYKGNDEEKYIIASTVLRWRSNLFPPPLNTRLFDMIRDLPTVLSALSMSEKTFDPIVICTLMAPQMEHTLDPATEANVDQPCDPTSILLDSTQQWSIRNRIALTWRMTVALCSPPTRVCTGVQRTFTKQRPEFNNNLVTYVAKAFQSLEGVAVESPYSFNVADNHVPDIWFVCE